MSDIEVTHFYLLFPLDVSLCAQLGGGDVCLSFCLLPMRVRNPQLSKANLKIRILKVQKFHILLGIPLDHQLEKRLIHIYKILFLMIWGESFKIVIVI